MADQFNVLVICGSLRKGSYNAALTRALPGLAPPGMKFVTAPALETLPLYNADMQETSGFPAPAQDLATAIRSGCQPRRYSSPAETMRAAPVVGMALSP